MSRGTDGDGVRDVGAAHGLRDADADGGTEGDAIGAEGCMLGEATGAGGGMIARGAGRGASPSVKASGRAPRGSLGAAKRESSLTKFSLGNQLMLMVDLPPGLPP